jgi:ATP synthase protein I
VVLRTGSEPFRIVLRWLACATIAAALLAGYWQGLHGAVSALLGGAVNLVAGAAFAWFAARGGIRTAGETLRTLIRAEATKVALIVAQLWLVLAHYKQVVPAAFFGTFILTVMLFSMAIFVRER